MKLENYGFIEAGRWILNNKLKSGIDFELYELAEKRTVYAFIVNDKPRYIGICQENTTSLKDRMERYKNRQGRNRNTKSKSTNERVAQLINECLKTNTPVSIFALKAEPAYDYIDLKIDFVKGLENPLISKFQPEWNK